MFKLSSYFTRHTPRNFTHPRYARWLSLVFLITITACQRSIVQEPLNTNYPVEDVNESLNFWHSLADRNVVSNDEAFHALINFANQSDPNENYAQRVAWLKERKMLKNSFDRPHNEAVSRGTVAKIITHMLNLKGGLTIQLTGISPRYALKELEYFKIMPPSTEHQGLSGVEFIGIITRAEEVQEERK